MVRRRSHLDSGQQGSFAIEAGLFRYKSRALLARRKSHLDSGQQGSFGIEAWLFRCRSRALLVRRRSHLDSGQQACQLQVHVLDLLYAPACSEHGGV